MSRGQRRDLVPIVINPDASAHERYVAVHRAYLETQKPELFQRGDAIGISPRAIEDLILRTVSKSMWSTSLRCSSCDSVLMGTFPDNPLRCTCGHEGEPRAWDLIELAKENVALIRLADQ